jgi:aldehyde dehydrogenase (NAD+)
MSVASETPALSEIPKIVDTLRHSFESGRTRPVEWRKQQLEQLRTMMREHADDFVSAMRSDFGKPELEAFASDVAIVVQEVGMAIKRLPKWMKARKVPTPIPAQPARSRIVSDPLGVVLIISPWNYPVQLLLSPLVGALAAGNCVVLKPSEVTPNTSALIAKLIPRYLDSDCVRVVEGAIPETTELLEQRFDHILYTGNGAVAKIVMTAAAKFLTPVTLELGGKSPCLVDKTANLDIAASRIAWGKFMNAGQTCIAPDYILADASIEEELVSKLKTAIEGFYGADPKANPDFGRIVNVRHHRRVAALLKDAGDVYAGGEVDEDDRYVAPTILRNVDPGSAVMQEEIFGPILPVLKVADLDEAVRFVNGREKPLALYLFSEDRGAEDRVIGETSSGGVCVNGTIFHLANHNLPFGGVGPSGMGAYHGRSSFDTFSHQKSVLRRATFFDLKIMYPPYTEAKKKMFRKML